MAIATAAPAVQTSMCPEQEFTPSLPEGGLNDTAGREEEFTVPAGVTRIEYQVLGGSGGGRSGTMPGGAGAIVTGEIAVTPETVLTLIVGQGGVGYPVNEQLGLTETGGKGYGDGGEATEPNAPHYFAGGSGGGGSAILLDGDPVIVAGGGGGAGSGMYSPDLVVHGTYSERPVGAPGDHTANNSTLDWSNHSIGFTGGGAASGSTSGPGGAEPSRPSNLVSFTASAGVNGSSHAAGGQGAAGSAITYDDSGSGIASGAGGGGYAGGGSGGASQGWFKLPANDPGFKEGLLAAAGGGGGGSSFVAPDAVGAVEVLSSSIGIGNNASANAGIRRPGSIILRYRSCE